MKHLFICATLIVGCASADGGNPSHPYGPSPEAQPVTTVDIAEREDDIPLCEGAHDPRPNECQTLVYGNFGYCNRWAPCSR